MTQSVFSPRYDQFRRQLIQARKAKGLTQTTLAKKLSRPQSFVSKYERGERRLDLVEFLEVADALGIDMHEFIRSLTEGGKQGKRP